jgi:3-oxoacyl-[acyl-carrier-protein] synthase II
MFLAGGVDAPITPGIIKGYSLLRALTQSWNDQPERASRPFSADRDGFVLAEGSWMFVLEDYEHAKARGARILAECRLPSRGLHRVPLLRKSRRARLPSLSKKLA